jgi:hypothetical protein
LISTGNAKDVMCLCERHRWHSYEACESRAVRGIVNAAQEAKRRQQSEQASADRAKHQAAKEADALGLDARPDGPAPEDGKT